MASAIEISKISHLIIKAGKNLSYFNKILKFLLKFLLNISQLLNCHERKKRVARFVFLFAMVCFQSVVICHGSLSDEQKGDSSL